MSESLREKAKRHPQIVNRSLIVVALVCLCTLVAISAVFQSKQAETNSAATQVALANATLERERAEAHSIALAAQARQLFNDGQGSLALALALEAAQLENPPIEAHNILADILYAPGIKEWHPLRVSNAVISSDGSTLAYMVDNELSVMDVASWTERQRIDFSDAIQAGTLGSQLYSTLITNQYAFIYDSISSQVIVFSIEAGTELYRFTGRYKLTADAQQMFVYDLKASRADLLNVATGEVIKELAKFPFSAFATNNVRFTFSRDNRSLYFYSDGSLLVYNIVTTELHSTNSGIDIPSLLLPYTTTDGHPYIMLGDEDHTYLWDARSLERTATISFADDTRLRTNFYTISPDNRSGVVLAPDRNSAYLQYLGTPDSIAMAPFEIPTWNSIELFDYDDEAWAMVSDVVYSPDSQTLYVLTRVGLAVWNIAPNEKPLPLPISSLHRPWFLHYDENVLYLKDIYRKDSLAVERYDLYRLDAPDWKVTYYYPKLDRFILSSDAKMLLIEKYPPSGADLSEISVLDAAANTELAHWQVAGHISSLSPDNQSVVVTARDFPTNKPSVRDVMTGQERYSITLDQNDLVAFHAGPQGTLWVWYSGPYSPDSFNDHFILYNAAGEMVKDYKLIEYDVITDTNHLKAEDGDELYLNFSTGQTRSEPPTLPHLSLDYDEHFVYRLFNPQQNRTLARWTATSISFQQFPRVREDGKMIYGVLDDEPVFWRIHTTEELIQLAHETRYIPELTCDQRELYRLAPCENEAATANP